MVAMLHLGYAFIPVGFALTGAALMGLGNIPLHAGLHSWLVGAMGTMMLAVMTRASLGHSGRALRFGRREAFIYAMILLAGVLRIVTAFGTVDWVLHASATALSRCRRLHYHAAIHRKRETMKCRRDHGSRCSLLLC